MSKVTEKIVAAHLTKYLQENDLLSRLQSAYKRHHSTETALLCVLSDIYAAADRQDVTLLGLLELSAAFDCVDHDILISRLQPVRHTWYNTFLDSVFSPRAHSASLLRWWSVVYHVAGFRRATRLRSRPVAVPAVHC